MWKITTRGFTLQEVLIMAAMNLAERTDSDRQRRANHLAQLRVIGWALEATLEARLAVIALEMALERSTQGDSSTEHFSADSSGFSEPNFMKCDSRSYAARALETFVEERKHEQELEAN